MKYRKNEAKEAAKNLLKGVWTALPTNFTADDRIDEAAMAWNLEHCISELAARGPLLPRQRRRVLDDDQRRADARARDQRRGDQGTRAADRRLSPSEPERSDQARAARAIGRHRLRHHPDALCRGARRRCHIRVLPLRLRAHRHRRRPVQYRSDLSDRRSAREAAREDPEHLRLQAGCIQNIVHDRAARSDRERGRGERRGRSAVGLQRRRDGRPLAAQLLPAPLPGARAICRSTITRARPRPATTTRPSRSRAA